MDHREFVILNTRSSLSWILTRLSLKTCSSITLWVAQTTTSSIRNGIQLPALTARSSSHFYPTWQRCQNMNIPEHSVLLPVHLHFYIRVMAAIMALNASFVQAPVLLSWLHISGWIFSLYYHDRSIKQQKTLNHSLTVCTNSTRGCREKSHCLDSNLTLLRGLKHSHPRFQSTVNDKSNNPLYYIFWKMSSCSSCHTH